MSTQVAVRRERRIPQWKLEEVEELSRLISSHRVVAVFKLTGLRANLLHELRMKLRGIAIFRVAKRSLFRKAAEKLSRDDLVRLVEDLKEPVGFIFSNLSAFKLKLILDGNRIPMHAKAGERADFDVVVPEMNTGLPPGPILSEFSKLGIPTRIEGGQIWIARDTVVARRGEEISPALASLLARLDVKAVLKGVSMERAVEDGILLMREQLEIDVDGMREGVRRAHIDAVALSLGVGYMTRETAPMLLLRGYLEARALAVEAELPSSETIRDIILKAEARALALKAAAKID